MRIQANIHMLRLNMSVFICGLVHLFVLGEVAWVQEWKEESEERLEECG